MKYAHLEKNTNKLLGWYADDIHDIIPTPNIEVSDEVWHEAIDINANCYEDGKFIVKDFRTPTETNGDRVQSIKYEAQKLITSKYPDYKQLNIIRQGGEALNIMSTYIDCIRSISNRAEIDGTELLDINWKIESLGE